MTEYWMNVMFMSSLVISGGCVAAFAATLTLAIDEGEWKWWVLAALSAVVGILAASALVTYAA